MTHEMRQPAGELLIRLDGVFDAATAWNVRGRLAALPHDVTVVLDFSQVRDFYDLGVAVMASCLAGREGPRVVVRGLNQHQHRMFRYFGVDLDALRNAPSPTPAPSGTVIAANRMH